MAPITVDVGRPIGAAIVVVTPVALVGPLFIHTDPLAEPSPWGRFNGCPVFVARET